MVGFLNELKKIINENAEFQTNGFKVLVGDFFLNTESFQKTITLINNGNTNRLFGSVVSDYDRIQIQAIVATKGESPEIVDTELFSLYKVLKKVKGNRSVYIVNVEPPVFVNKTSNGVFLYNIFLDLVYSYEC